MAVVYVHGVAIDADTSQDAATHRGFMNTHVNRKLRRRFKYSEVEWYGLSRRCDVDFLMGRTGTTMSAMEDSDAYHYDQYLKRQLCPSNETPDPKQVLDYLALGTVDPAKYRDDPDEAAQRLAALFDWLAAGAPGSDFASRYKNWSDIQLLASQMSVPPDDEEGTGMSLGFDSSQYVWDRFQELVGLEDQGYAASNVRRSLAQKAVRFASDSFTYALTRHQIDASETIKTRVVGNILTALKDHAETYPLILVGHSFGGVILYDILSDSHPSYEFGAALARRPILLISVGSQIAMFHNIGFFSRDATRQPEAIEPTLPRMCTAWLNIYHNMDPLGYSIRKNVSQITDSMHEIELRHTQSVGEAHGAYLTSAYTWSRMGEWIGHHS